MGHSHGAALGIDLGGTAVKAGVVTREGRIVGRGQRPTQAHQGAALVIASMAEAARAAIDDAGLSVRDLDGVGLGAPGICDVPRGVVVEAVNLGWRQVPAGALLTEALDLPAYLDNDANCAALGEQWCGAARGSRHMVLLTVGTGVGGGLVLNGQIYHGHMGWAGEIGHMPAVENGPRCNCGQLGCLETVASATAIALAARAAIGSGSAPRLAQLAQGQDAEADARTVIEAAREGDGPALAILAEAGSYLGTAIAALASALNPELVVIGGGVSAAGELLLEPVRRAVSRRAMPGPASVARIVPALLGNDAGLIGAASLVWR